MLIAAGCLAHGELFCFFFFLAVLCACEASGVSDVDVAAAALESFAACASPLLDGVSGVGVHRMTQSERFRVRRAILRFFSEGRAGKKKSGKSVFSALRIPFWPGKMYVERPNGS
jgi:hypothetical protein